MATKPGSPVLDGGNSLSAGLLVGLMLGEGSGGTSTDLSGNGHTGTLTAGASWTTGASGNVVACTGGGYVSVPWPDTAGTDSFSFCVIHKPTTYPSGFTNLYTDGSGGWEIYLSTGGSMSFSSSMITIGGSEAMTTGTLWQYLYTRDRAGGVTTTGTVYVNGSQTNTGNSGTGSATSVTMKFGALQGSGANYDGIYDAIYLWNRVLTAPEIASLASDPYQMFRGGTPPVALPPRSFVTTRAVNRASTY